MEENKKTNNATLEPVPYIAHEAEMARMERVNRRWFLAWLITFILLVGCVAGFLWYEAQFTDEIITIDAEQTTEGGGNNYALGGDYYGAAESENFNQKANP